MTSETEERPSRPNRFLQAWSGWPGRVFRLLFALLPIWWLVKNVDLAATVAHLSLRTAPYFAAALAVNLLGISVGSVRWAVLLKGYGGAHVPRVRTLFRHYLVGTYYNAIPSGLVGEAVRGFRLQSVLKSLPASYTVVIVERVSGLAALLLIALAALLLPNPHLDPGAVLDALYVGGAASLLLVFVLLGLPLAVRSQHWARRAVEALPVVGRLMLRMVPPRSARSLLAGFLLSLVTQALALLANYLLLHPLAPAVSLLSVFSVVPFVMLLCYIPLTPAAIGQREVLFVYFLGLVSVTAETAVAASLLSFALGLTLCLCGGVLHLLERLFHWQ